MLEIKYPSGARVKVKVIIGGPQMMSERRHVPPISIINES